MASKNTAPGSSASSKMSVVDGFVCRHKREVILKTAGTPNNFGRRFFRCPYWNDKKADCGFFKWVDERPREAQAATGDDFTNKTDELGAKIGDLEIALTEATEMVRNLRSLLEQGGSHRDGNLVREFSRVADKLELVDSRMSYVVIVLVCVVAVLMVVVLQNVQML
ncbi:hypothetical protein LINPERHAP1_LOCUS31323 [Linum perenne]